MLSSIDILNSIFSFLFVVISVVLGIKIMLKYKLQKDIKFLLVGIA